MNKHRATLPISQIIMMNFGFLGIQYSFGLQQTAINPIYSYLGANPDQLPFLNLAGPITGLIIQPIIGAMSDRTWHPTWGRRKPYFLIGAILCSLCLFAFPFSSTLWMAAGLLWILDAANNTSMEPYRAFIADHLNEAQQPKGFLAQSFFTGLGITLANFSLYFFQKWFDNGTKHGGLPFWVYLSFFIGCVVSFTSVYFSTKGIKEYPPTDEELHEIKTSKLSFTNSVADIFKAIANMPKILWHLSLIYLFQWYALFCYWQYITLSVSSTLWHSSSPTSSGYSEAVGWTGFMNGTYNAVAFVSALLMMRLTQQFKAKNIHAISLLLAAIGLLIIPLWPDKNLTLISMFGMGIAWASIMGIPYIFVVPHIPAQKYGVYMGIINMMIVIPMFIQTLTFSSVYKTFLGSNPTNAILFAGSLMMIASIITFFIKEKKVN